MITFFLNLLILYKILFDIFLNLESMGSYLNKPRTEKCSEDFETNDRYECGLSGMQGWRAAMEVYLL